MPAKFKIKNYQGDSFYHVYNTGANHQAIFQDANDYTAFTNFLGDYLSPRDNQDLLAKLSSPDTKTDALKLLRLNNFGSDIELVAFCLMPDHFHLLLKQHSPRALEKFMRSLSTRYVQHYNKHHSEHSGPLFQDTYKAAVITDPQDLLHVSRHIHRNSRMQNVPLKNSIQPSSFRHYVYSSSPIWLHPEHILNSLSHQGLDNYEAFTEDDFGYQASLSKLEDLFIDSAS